MEDFRTLYERCEEIELVSIEKDRHVFDRQKFHLPCRKLKLLNLDIFSFIDEYEANEQKSIFWLDYTDLEYTNFEYFELLLRKVSVDSMVKLSLRADARDFSHPEKQKEFKDKFQAIMPDPGAVPPGRPLPYAKFLQDMVELVVQRAFRGQSPYMFQPINSFYYRDANGMLTVTGIVCLKAESSKIQDAFRDWEFANFDWSDPASIEVPMLSTKERLLLQEALPCSKPAGEILMNALGYRLMKNKSQTKRQLDQYADFHRYYPYFIRGIP